MNEKTQKFNKIRLNNKEFHKFKQPIDLDLVTVDQIVIFDSNILLNRCVLFCHK